MVIHEQEVSLLQRNLINALPGWVGRRKIVAFENYTWFIVGGGEEVPE